MNAKIPGTAEILQSALACLDKLPTHEPGGNRKLQEWARDLAKDWGPHTTQASTLRESGCSSEYLVDVSVTADLPKSSASDPFGYEGLSFAMEVEWSPNWIDRRYDFCKLADVRASRKLFIGACTAAQWQKLGSELDAMQSFLNAHSMAGKTEEFGVIICSYGNNEDRSGWVLTKNKKRKEVRVSRPAE